MTVRDVAGCRVLVVEDEMLIAVQIEDTLLRLGCEIVGPAAKLETALQLVDERQFDVAILDVTLRGGKVYPVAEKLAARGIPFVFASGYGDWALPAALRNRPRLMKPYTSGALEQQIRALCEDIAAG
jgi:two-component SAPR family response regulator